MKDDMAGRKQQTNLDVGTGTGGDRSSSNFTARDERGAAFTLIELLVVIGIIALLASLVVGGTHYASTAMRRNRIRAELNQLVTAIEAYFARFNQYPPDNVVNGIVNPVTNQLFYELTGVLVNDDKGGRFYLPGRQRWLNSAIVQQFFHTDGFLNSGTSPKEIKQCAAFKSEQHKAIFVSGAGSMDDVEVLRVPVDWPLNDPSNPPPFNGMAGPNVKQINPWRYVGPGHATNNPAGFDLWAEYVEGGKTKIICNWSKEVLEK